MKDQDNNHLVTNISDLSFEEILDNVIDEIYVIDKNNILTYANKASRQRYQPMIENTIGVSNEEISKLGCFFPSIVPLIQKEKKSLTVEQKCFDGQMLLTTVMPILDKDNQLVNIVCCSRDISYLQNIKYNYASIKKAMLSMTDDKEVQTNFIKLMDKNTLQSKNKHFTEIIRIINKIAPTDANVLLTGETGTGKTLIAQYIHTKSENPQGPFVSLNCATIPESLFESELFGYKKGAFTGANKDTQGLFDAANSGTLFLDEISEIPLSFQSKLLKAIQEKSFYPVGCTIPHKVNIRIIAASNQNFEEMIKESLFRPDLYYRLNVINLTLPPLRDRLDDIPYLCHHFFKAFNEKYKVYRHPSAILLETLKQHSWPGNIRELENTLERSILLSDSDEVGIDNLPHNFTDNIINIVQSNIEDNDPSEFLQQSFKQQVESLENRIINHAFKQLGSSYKVAQALSISQTTAHRLIHKYINDSEA